MKEYFEEIYGGMTAISEMIANGDSAEAMYCVDPHVKYSKTCGLSSFFPMKKITDMKLGELTKPGLQFFELKTEVTVE